MQNNKKIPHQNNKKIPYQNNKKIHYGYNPYRKEIGYFIDRFNKLIYPCGNTKNCGLNDIEEITSTFSTCELEGTTWAFIQYGSLSTKNDDAACRDYVKNNICIGCNRCKVKRLCHLPWYNAKEEDVLDIFLCITCFYYLKEIEFEAIFTLRSVDICDAIESLPFPYNNMCQDDYFYEHNKNIKNKYNITKLKLIISKGWYIYMLLTHKFCNYNGLIYIPKEILCLIAKKRIKLLI